MRAVSANPGEPRAFAGLLQQYRARIGLTHSDIARATGFCPSHIGRLERGERFPARPTAERIVAVLELDELDAARLLVAAGYAPPMLQEVGWSRPIAQLAGWLRREQEERCSKPSE